MDMFAAEIGHGPGRGPAQELHHRRSRTRPSTGANYDSGEYHAALDKCLANAGYDELRADQAARRDRGDVVQLGIGICSYVEWTGFGSELGTCEVDEDGTVTVTAGTSSHGQGHETSYAQLVAGTLGVPLADVKVIQSDTAKVAARHGHDGLALAAGRRHRGAAGDRRGAREGPRLAAHLLEADAGDIEVVPGQGLGVAGSPASAIPWARAGRGRGRPVDGLPEGFDGGLAAENDFETPDATYPFGTHLAVVEVDTETGLAKLVRHITVDDSGPHPRTRCWSRARSTAASRRASRRRCSRRSPSTRTATTSPARSRPTRSRARATCRRFETERTQTPTPRNPLGAKGIGESGAIGSTPAVWNAVVDALSHLGVRNIDMPAPPQRVWQAIEDAKTSNGAAA